MTPPKSSTVRGNGMWDAAQQGATTLANAVIALLIVTALSVNDYGAYAYATALASLAMSIMNAGLGGLAVRYLVESRPKNKLVVTGMLVARMALAAMGYLIAATISLTSGSGEVILATLVALSALFGKALEGPESWFLSHLRSRRTASARFIVTILMFGARLAAIVYFPSLTVFVCLFLVEALFSGLAVLLLYIREVDSPGIARPDMRSAFRLIRESLPLLLSGVANQITLRANIIIVQSILGSTSVGVFAVAGRISELAYFLPVVFMNSLLPHLMTLRADLQDPRRYQRLLQKAYGRAFWAGIIVAVVVGASGASLIPAVFGHEYRDSVGLLLIYLGATPFVFMAAVYSKWIIAEKVLWASLLRHGIGALLSVLLGVVLVGAIGVAGAAIATLVAYIFASYVSAFFTKSTRGQALMMTEAFIYPLKSRRLRSRDRGGPDEGNID